MTVNALGRRVRENIGQQQILLYLSYSLSVTSVVQINNTDETTSDSG